MLLTDCDMARDHERHNEFVKSIYSEVSEDFAIRTLSNRMNKALGILVASAKEDDIIQALSSREDSIFVLTPHYTETISKLASSIYGWTLNPSEFVHELHHEISEHFADYIKSPIAFVNTRAWITRPRSERFGPNAMHTDGFAQGYFKVMIYPFGLSEEKGGIQLGNHRITNAPAGTCICFKNSDIEHSGIPGTSQSRFCVEVTLLRALEARRQCFSSHFNGRHFKSPSYAYAEEGYKGTISAGTVFSPCKVNIGSGPCQFSGPWHGWKLLDEIEAPNIKKVKFNARTYSPVASHSAELVYTSHHIEHVDSDTFNCELLEARRMLADNGFLLIKLPDYEHFLDAYRNNRYEVMLHKGIEPVICTWKSKGVSDTFLNRLSMMFCGYWNTYYGDHYCGPRHLNDPLAYHGPAILKETILCDMLESLTPKQIARELCNIAQAEKDFSAFNHQQAWSEAELIEDVELAGFSHVTSDKDRVISRFSAEIPDLTSLDDWSGYHLFKPV